MKLKLLLVLLLAGAARGENLKSEIPNPAQIDDGARVVWALRGTAPRIDGDFDAAWLAAEPADRFVQRRPHEGAPESVPTRAYVLYDDDAIYTCFVCRDDAPDSISARILRRDNTANCDLVGLYLDSFHDHRNCYYFAVTAAGGQIDGTMTNETDQDPAWDGIWESAVGRTDSGWVAEFRIPFSSFRHGGARPDGWGFNLVRSIDRRKEALFWQPVNNQRGLRVNEFGNLEGLSEIGSSRHLELLPHAVARYDARQDSSWKSRSEWEDIGLYAKYVPASTWAADFAYQPDFAQVDVDDEVLNLSDYPIFITEKRPFFLEVNEFFDTAPISLLYTRRITDPDFAARTYGVSEKFRGMVLGGQNRTEDGRGQAVGAGRAQWNVGKQSSIGLTGTGLRQDRGILYDLGPAGLYNPFSDYFAYAGGADIRVRWNTEDQWTFTGAGVSRAGLYDQPLRFSDLKGSKGAGDAAQPFEFRNSVYMDLRTLRMKAQVGNTYRGQDYNINDLGWGDFSNTVEHTLWLGNRWLAPEAGFYQVGVDINGWQRSMPDGSYPEGGGQVNLSGVTNGNWQIGAGTDWGIKNRRRYTFDAFAGEFRDNFFEYYGRFNIEPHPYHSQWAWVTTDTRRWLSGGTEGNYGDFWEGKRWIWNSRMDVLPRSNLETGVAVEWMRVWGIGEIENYQPTDGRLWRWRTRYSPTLNLSLRATLQWIEVGHWMFTGYESNTLVTNLMLAWNWRPGSWFYLVYDEGRQTPVRYDTERDRTVRVKGTYFLAVK